MSGKLRNEEMIDVKSALEELKKRADYFELSTTVDGWRIECKIREMTMVKEHDNLWYLLNLALDKLRANLVFEKPVHDVEISVGKWVNYDPPLSFRTKCICGALAVKIRGLEQKGTPCRASEFECKHGHRWRTSFNCD